LRAASQARLTLASYVRERVIVQPRTGSASNRGDSMSTLRITLRRAVAGSALIAAAALPLQSGVAHAATPDEEFSSCLSTIDANYRDALTAGTDYDLSSAIDQCVNTFLTEMGTDDATINADATAAPVTVDSAVDDGGVNGLVTVDIGG